jgi:hypothetical protein
MYLTLWKTFTFAYLPSFLPCFHPCLNVLSFLVSSSLHSFHMFILMEDLYFFFFPSPPLPIPSFAFSLSFTFFPSLRFSQLGQAGLKLLILLSQPSDCKDCRGVPPSKAKAVYIFTCILVAILNPFIDFWNAPFCDWNLRTMLLTGLSKMWDKEVDRKKQAYSTLSLRKLQVTFSSVRTQELQRDILEHKGLQRENGQEIPRLDGAFFPFPYSLSVFHSISKRCLASVSDLVDSCSAGEAPGIFWMECLDMVICDSRRNITVKLPSCI